MTQKENAPLVLAILDGWGVGPKDKEINAIAAAKTPFFDSAAKDYPYTQLSASGRDVGLEENQMSGSETGHMNIGAGRIVEQDVREILESIDSGTFFQNPVFLGAINHVKKHDSKIHLMGLLGNDDSPHSHPDIFLALLILAEKSGLGEKIFFHFFTDGRDSYPQSALDHWKEWNKEISQVGAGKIASVAGRFYGMDRTKNWDRLKKAYEAIVEGRGEQFHSFKEAIETNYQKNNTDEYVEPAIIVENGKPVAKVESNDAVIFFNFRSDRARQISKMFVGTNTKREKGFPDHAIRENLFFVAMTNFGPDLDLETAYPTDPVSATLPGTLSKFKQLYISETEKFAHITYFINGGYPDPVGGEERVMIASEKVKSYAKKPEMSAGEIANVISKSIHYGVYDVVVTNFANADMVGHTGDFKATVKAIETVDQQLKKVYQEIEKRNGVLLLTADHGNADIMIDKKSKKLFTFHTKNPVPFALITENKEYKKVKLKEGVLGNVAPSVLKILNYKQPEQMTKESLF